MENKISPPTINIGIKLNDKVIVPAIIPSQTDKQMGQVITLIQKQS
jgi:hypothetical protein